MWRSVRWAGRIALAFVLLPVMWFLAGLAGAAIPAAGGSAASDAVEVRLIAGPLHYDFLLPATPHARAAFDFAAIAGVPVRASETAWILVGWGARDFYTATGRSVDMEARPVLRAVTGDRAVLRLDAWPDFAIENAGPGLRVLRMSRVEYDALLAAIVADLSGPPVADAGFTPTDRFFAAAGRFDILRTCNVWVGAKLRAAGLRFGIWTPTPQAVRLALALHQPG